MTRLVVVADIRLYRDGIAQSLEAVPGIECIGTAADGPDALTQASVLDPDVILLDMAMLASAATARALAEAAPGVKVIALAVPETEGHVIACAEAGIAGYVPREGSLDDLVAAVESAAQGEMVCSPQIAAGLLRRVAHLSAASRPAPPEANLTSRELEIVDLIDRMEQDR